MASRWKKPSVLTKYLRSRSRSVGGGPRGRRLPKTNRHGFQVRVRFSDLSDDVDSGQSGSNKLCSSIQSSTMDVEDNMGEVYGSSDGEDENVMQCHRRRKKRSYRIIHTREQEAWEKLHPILYTALHFLIGHATWTAMHVLFSSCGVPMPRLLSIGFLL